MLTWQQTAVEAGQCLGSFLELVASIDGRNYYGDILKGKGAATGQQWWRGSSVVSLNFH
jgi:hypothetical protein